jgi:hypothetical protein
VSTIRVSTAALQAEFGGCWVALKDGNVVEARRSPYELIQALKERDISDTTIVRVPAADEPEIVGIG